MREASLLSALAKAPLPGKFVPQPLKRPSAGTPLELPNAAATVKVSKQLYVRTSSLQTIEWHLWDKLKKGNPTNARYQ